MLSGAGLEYFLLGEINMATNEELSDLFDRYMRIENEIKMLQQDRKELLEEYKQKVDPKSFKAALRAAKIISGLKPHEKDDFDRAFEAIEKKIMVV